MDKREDSLPPDDATIADDREAVALETELDEDDRLKPEFVRDVIELAEAGEGEAARERVGRLPPADIADLFELARPAEPPHHAAVPGALLPPHLPAETKQ